MVSCHLQEWNTIWVTLIPLTILNQLVKFESLKSDHKNAFRISHTINVDILGARLFLLARTSELYQHTW